MTDRYGATAIPLVVSEAGTDPLLAYVGAYLQAVGNAQASAAWEAVAPPLGALPVRFVFTHDPAVTDFNDARTPALFLWRRDALRHELRSTDERVRTSRLACLWVLPNTGKPEVITLRSHFAWKLFAIFDAALEKGRDPSWVVTGDTYFDPATYGSTLARWARFRKLTFASVKPEPLEIQILDDRSKTKPKYTAFLGELDLEEELVRDAELNDELDGIEQAVDQANP